MLHYPHVCPGPPDPPTGVRLQVIGAESITLSWFQDGSTSVDMWHVLCVNNATGEVVRNRYEVFCSWCGL